MFKNMKIGMRLAAGFAVVLVLLIVISAVSIMRMDAINAATEDIVNKRIPIDCDVQRSREKLTAYRAGVAQRIID